MLILRFSLSQFLSQHLSVSVSLLYEMNLHFTLDLIRFDSIRKCHICLCGQGPLLFIFLFLYELAAHDEVMDETLLDSGIDFMTAVNVAGETLN